jgi:hypothetical protein
MMRSFQIALLALCATFTFAAEPVQDGCPKNEIACLDVINSSQCIEQLVVENQAPVTKEAMVKCIETEGSASTLPGAARVCSNPLNHRIGMRAGERTLANATQYCRCPGCHSKPINDAIAALFPPPCA